MSATYEQVRATRCPNCNAGPGEPCTSPTSSGRRETLSLHYSREAAAEERVRVEASRPDPVTLGEDRHERHAAVREKIAQDVTAEVLANADVETVHDLTGTEEMIGLITAAARLAIARYRGEN